MADAVVVAMWNHDLASTLIVDALVTFEQVRAAIAASAGTTTRWFEYLVWTGALDERAAARAISREAGVPECDLGLLAAVPAAIQAVVPRDLAVEHRIVPLTLEPDGDVCVAMSNPFDLRAVRELEFFIGRGVLREVAAATPIAWALNAYYGGACALWPPRDPVASTTAPRLARGSAPPPFTSEAAWYLDVASTLAGATSIVAPAVPEAHDDAPTARIPRRRGPTLRGRS